MSKAQTLARTTLNARLGGTSFFPVLPTGPPTRAWCAPREWLAGWAVAVTSR